LKNRAGSPRFNLLNYKYLVRGAWCVVAAAGLSCGGGAKPSPEQAAPKPPPTIPLPTAGLAGQHVALYPLTLVAAEEALRWDTLVTNRRTTLPRADSVILSLMTGRAPEVNWITPDQLRRAARRAVGIATDPDQMGGSVLRDEKLDLVPSPLNVQLRTLNALVDSRFAVIPAALIYKHRAKTPDAPLLVTTAELMIVMVDVRQNRIAWRTTARGDGADPWTALTAAVKGLTPGLP
jgi:hypothetical protein